jgi:hypothetical protein
MRNGKVVKSFHRRDSKKIIDLIHFSPGVCGVLEFSREKNTKKHFPDAQLILAHML